MKESFNMIYGKMQSIRRIFGPGSLRKNINKYGVRNSLLLAPMPTASTAQILGSYECFEPPQTNVYARRVMAGEYMVWNEYLIRDLQSLNLWCVNSKIK